MPTALIFRRVFVIFVVLGFSFSVHAVSNMAAAERKKISSFAAKSDLDVKEWLKFVSELDKKCDQEKDVKEQEALCSLYSEIYLTEELFKEPEINVDACHKTKFTMISLSTNVSTLANLDRIVNKLCNLK